MTYRDKLKMERPECVSDDFIGGCDDCWSQEIPETQTNPKDSYLWPKDNLYIPNPDLPNPDLPNSATPKPDADEACKILDSGNRREFGTGAVRDIQEGKGRMDLLPWAAVMELSKHCENGAKKYGEHNVDKGIPTHSLCDSAARHLAKYLDGWTDEPHLLAAAWNLMWAIQMEIKHKELVDTPWRKKDTTTDIPQE